MGCSDNLFNFSEFFNIAMTSALSCAIHYNLFLHIVSKALHLIYIKTCSVTSRSLQLFGIPFSIASVNYRICELAFGRHFTNR
jgi:hypothetical protein